MSAATIDSRPDRRRGILAASAEQAVFWAIILIMTVSGGLLWYLGLNYDGISGSPLSKIHPATYIVVAAFALRAIALGNPIGVLSRDAERVPGAAVLLVASLLLLAHIVSGDRPMLSTTVDTYILPALLMVFLVDFDEGRLRRLETALHLIMVVNALLGLAEALIGERLFPYRFEGDVGYDTRSNALQGHALVNAVVTGTYLLSLAAGGGRLSGRTRLLVVLLQYAALVVFGGRTAFVLTTLLLAPVILWRVHASVRGGSIPILAVAAAAFAAPIALAGVGFLAVSGFFEPLVARFLNDGGSAETRLLMFHLLAQIPGNQLLLGPDISFVDSVRRVEGLESGVENPVIRLLVYQGVLATVGILLGLCACLWEVLRRVRRDVTVPLFFFLVVIMSFESISSKSTLVAKIAVLLLVLHRRAPGPLADVPRRRGPVRSRAVAPDLTPRAARAPLS